MFQLIAGPCVIESEEMVLSIAARMKFREAMADKLCGADENDHGRTRNPLHIQGIL